MKVKLTFLVALFGLLVGIQSAQAQRTTVKIDRSKVVLDASDIDISKIRAAEFQGVSGTINVPKPLASDIKRLQCNQIEVSIGEISQEKSANGGVALPTFKAIAVTKASGSIASGKCSYYISNPKFNQTTETYQLMLAIPVNKTTCQYLSIDHDSKSVTYPTAAKNQVVNFDAKPTCSNIN